MAPASSRPIYGIDLVRFLAAVAVVLYHFSAKPFLMPGDSTVAAVLWRGDGVPAPSGHVWWGWIGVQVFFVVSGAVIAFSARRAGDAGGGGWQGFAVGRLARLWPAMIACSALVVVLNVGWWGHAPAREAMRLLGSLAFLPTGPWVSGQFWTLPVEVTFYALVGMMIAFGRQASLEMLAWGLGLGSLAYWLLAAAGVVHPGAAGLWTLAWHGVYFAMGIVIMAAGTSGLTPARLLLIAVCCLGAWIETGAAAEKELPGLGHGAVLPFMLWLGVTAFIFWSVVRRREVGDWVKARPALARAVRAMGLATYPLYLVHVQPGALVMRVALAGGVPVWGAVALATALALILALLVALVLEPLLTRLVRHGLRGLLSVRGGRWQAA